MEPFNRLVKVETHRSGIFTFQAGIDINTLQPLIDRVEDAHARFVKVPKLPDAINQLEHETLVSSVHGTNSIEGGTLSTRETSEALDLPPEQVKEEEQRRVANIRDAYKLAEEFAIEIVDETEQPFIVVEDIILALHKYITEGLTHPHNIPGKYRDNPKELPTKVGDERHGGVYKPPKCCDDIKILMTAFIKWINKDDINALSPLIRAPLAHYYFERIHPFWDGNGRVGRVVEAMILKAAGYKYASDFLSTYYLKNIDSYFTVFNTARKAAKQKEQYPNNVFVEFFLKGMLDTINKNHDLIDYYTSRLLYESMLRKKHDRKEINFRQYTIVSNILAKNIFSVKLPDIQIEPWYQSLYKKRTIYTASRDLKGLVQNKLIEIDKDKTIRLLFP